MKITAKHLTKAYKNGVYAVNDFSVEINSGEFVVALGESGCGKTTLLRLLSGLETPTAGELYFNDVLFSDMPVNLRDTAYVFQEYVLYPKMTVWENVAAALSRYGLSRDEEEKRVYKVLCDFDLIKFRSQLPRNLSGGQQQRVALARAVVRNPSLILFDEPLSNIAEEQRSEYVQIIKNLKNRLPETTFVYVTHNIREALILSQKLLIMSEGRLLQYGSREHVLKNPYCAEVLRVLGNTEDINGVLQNGVVTCEDGEIYSFNGVSVAGEVTVIKNPYKQYEPCLFDKYGNTLLGESKYVKLNGEYDGKKLMFCGTSYNSGESFGLRYTGSRGKVEVLIPSIKLRTYELFGDISFKAEESKKNYYKTSGGSFYLFGERQFNGKFYCSPEDITLYQNGKQVLATYNVYQSFCIGRASYGKIFMRSGKLNYTGKQRGKICLSFNKNAFCQAVKKGGLKAECIAEENVGDAKLAYFIIKGFDKYVALLADVNQKFFGVKKLRITIDPQYILAERIK